MGIIFEDEYSIVPKEVLNEVGRISDGRVKRKDSTEQIVHLCNEIWLEQYSKTSGENKE